MKKLSTMILGLMLTIATSSVALAADYYDGIGNFALVLGAGGRLITDKQLTSSPAYNNPGFIVSGGATYRIHPNLVLDGAVEYSKNSFQTSSVKVADVNRVDALLGINLRTSTGPSPVDKIIPFVGAGAALIFPMISITNDYHLTHPSVVEDTETAYGGYLKIGADYNFSLEYGVTLEVKGLLASKIKLSDADGASSVTYDPSSISTTLGLKFHF